MNENEFEVDGKVYVSTAAAEGAFRCDACTFRDVATCFSCKVPPCSYENRKDGRNVFFVEKQS